ncbi:thiolase family protein [Vibrio sp. SCSIO 43135]|uniref:thiolase family protein n=1 Tax=Vibrio sp. SCSIO 43135 TaxID=2819096 RepID=UPI0020757551|nr:thiolase family protein [Vibrio sp. SCSIO 43135]USD44151.1 thiolase family protein [Vibrio sp. SCSIO 43135]
MDENIWVVSAKRTPMGSFQGALTNVSGPKLGSIAIKGALADAHLPTELVDEVYMGCVLPAGVGQAPARQAALGAGLPESVGCTTLNKVCGSGLKTVMLAHDLIRAGSISCAVAGGMESMTNAPYLLTESRQGMRMGHKSTYDHMFLDGLQDAYEGELMGVYAQQTADRFGLSREKMDEWATLSVERALAAQNSGKFSTEIAPVIISDRHGNEIIISDDQHPQSIDPAKIPKLRPAFAKEGTVTAANSSAISDGAAALVLMSESAAKKQGLTPLAVIAGHATHARQPSEFTTAPVYAMQALLDKLDWKVDDVDLWEINEAFAVVTQVAVEQLGIAAEKVNIHGGACALGHPIGASGARILVTLIHALKQLDIANVKPLRGVASLCIGGGEAVAIGIEVPRSH